MKYITRDMIKEDSALDVPLEPGGDSIYNHDIFSNKAGFNLLFYCSRLFPNNMNAENLSRHLFDINLLSRSQYMSGNRTAILMNVSYICKLMKANKINYETVVFSEDEIRRYIEEKGFSKEFCSQLLDSLPYKGKNEFNTSENDHAFNILNTYFGAFVIFGMDAFENGNIINKDSYMDYILNRHILYAIRNCSYNGYCYINKYVKRLKDDKGLYDNFIKAFEKLPDYRKYKIFCAFYYCNEHKIITDYVPTKKKNETNDMFEDSLVWLKSFNDALELNESVEMILLGHTPSDDVKKVMNINEKINVIHDHLVNYTNSNLNKRIDGYSLRHRFNSDYNRIYSSARFQKCSCCGKSTLSNMMYDSVTSASHINPEFKKVCVSCVAIKHVFSDYYNAYVHIDDACYGITVDGDEVWCNREALISDQERRDEWEDVGDDEDRPDDIEDYWIQEPRENLWKHPALSTNIHLVHYHGSKSRQAIMRDKYAERYKNRYIGIELEVECDNSTTPYSASEILTTELNKDVPTVFFERDSSLSNGFEIITQPMSFLAQRNFWKWLEKKTIRRGLKSHNTSTCGLHVHVSKKSLSKLQLSRIISFMNNPINQNFIEKLARRKGGRWSQFNSKYTKIAHNYGTERYSIVNNNNSNTIEFRIFKGTLKYTSLLGTIEFVNALCSYTDLANSSYNELSWNKFYEYIQQPAIKKDCSNLLNYIEERKICA